MRHILIYLLLVTCLAACATPHVQLASSIAQPSRLTPDRIIMDDGYELPLAIWQPEAEPQAIVLALHGCVTVTHHARTYPVQGLLGLLLNTLDTHKVHPWGQRC